MKSLFFMIIISLHSSDLTAQMTSNIIVMLKVYDSEASLEICRGIAIHPRVVMTAAECVDGLLPTDLLVRNLHYGLISDLSNITIHPEYIECIGSNNFAILVTENFITPKRLIACLPDEAFFNNPDFDVDCSNKLITTKLFTRFSSDNSQCLISIPRYYWPEEISDQVCKLSDKEIPNILKSRQVKMSICTSHTTNSQCSAYYFSHGSSINICSSYNKTFFITSDQHTSFVYDVVPWIQNQVQKYVNGVPQVSACILTLIVCIVTHFSR